MSCILYQGRVGHADPEKKVSIFHQKKTNLVTINDDANLVIWIDPSYSLSNLLHILGHKSCDGDVCHCVLSPYREKFWMWL